MSPYLVAAAVLGVLCLVLLVSAIIPSRSRRGASPAFWWIETLVDLVFFWR